MPCPGVQGPADAAPAVLAPDEDFLDPGDRPEVAKVYSSPYAIHVRYTVLKIAAATGGCRSHS